MRQTPYRGIRYPFSSDVVDPAAIQTLAQDVDQYLVNDDQYRAEAFRRTSAFTFSTGTVSLAKGVASAIPWANVSGQNGANGIPGYANWWSSGSPTRFTAPGTCLVYATALVQLNVASALGTTGYFEVFWGKNGSGATPNIQLNRIQPQSATFTGSCSCSIESMWALVAGDYIEVKAQWTGTPAGPLSTTSVGNGAVMVMAVP